MQPLKIHATTLSTQEPSEELGRQMVRLRYDLLLLIVKGMRDEALRQSVEDANRGRLQLGLALRFLDQELGRVVEALTKVVEICEPYIQREIDQERRSPIAKTMDDVLLACQRNINNIEQKLIDCAHAEDCSDEFVEQLGHSRKSWMELAEDVKEMRDEATKHLPRPEGPAAD